MAGAYRPAPRRRLQGRRRVRRRGAGILLAKQQDAAARHDEGHGGGDHAIEDFACPLLAPAATCGLQTFIIGGPRCRVSQGHIGRADPLEPLLRPVIAGIRIRMPGFRQHSECQSDRLVVGVRSDAESIVVRPHG